MTRRLKRTASRLLANTHTALGDSHIQPCLLEV